MTGKKRRRRPSTAKSRIGANRIRSGRRPCEGNRVPALRGPPGRTVNRGRTTARCQLIDRIVEQRPLRASEFAGNVLNARQAPPCQLILAVLLVQLNVLVRLNPNDSGVQPGPPELDDVREPRTQVGVPAGAVGAKHQPLVFHRRVISVLDRPVTDQLVATGHESSAISFSQVGSGSRAASQARGMPSIPVHAATMPPTIAAVVSMSPPTATQVRIACG